MDLDAAGLERLAESIERVGAELTRLIEEGLQLRLRAETVATPRPPLWVGPVVTVTSFVTVTRSSKVQGNPSGWCR